MRGSRLQTLHLHGSFSMSNYKIMLSAVSGTIVNDLNKLTVNACHSEHVHFVQCKLREESKIYPHLGRNKDFSVALLLRNDNFLLSSTINYPFQCFFALLNISSIVCPSYSLREIST